MSAHTTTIRALSRQNAYANQVLFSVARTLSQAQLEATTSPSRETAYTLLVHVLAAEAHYLSQLTGSGPTLTPAIRSAFEQVQAFAADHQRRLDAYVNTLSEDDLLRPVTIKFSAIGEFQFAVWQVLLQVFLHSAQHRGELSILLSGLGHPLPIDDVIVHFARESGQPWPH